MPVLLKENFNRWYSLRSYYLAITISDIPFQVSIPLNYMKVAFSAHNCFPFRQSSASFMYQSYIISHHSLWNCSDMDYS